MPSVTVGDVSVSNPSDSAVCLTSLKIFFRFAAVPVSMR